MTAVGVRSSCEASDVNRLSASKARSKRFKHLVKRRCKLADLVLPGGSPIRWDRSRPSLMRLAAATMRSIGWNARRTIR